MKVIKENLADALWFVRYAYWGDPDMVARFGEEHVRKARRHGRWILNNMFASWLLCALCVLAVIF